MIVKKVQSVKENVKECPVLGGIDTLYAFIDTHLLSLNSLKLYHNLWFNVKNDTFVRDGYTFLNFSGKKQGFVGAWYLHTKDKIPLYRIGFKDPNKQRNVRDIYLQLEASGIYYLGFHQLIEYVKTELSSILEEDITNSHILPSRVDLNAFIGGYDFSSLNADLFRTTFKKDIEVSAPSFEYENEEDLKSFHFSSRRRLQTLYLGSKSSPLYFKIYDKNLELSAPGIKISSMIKKYFLLSQGFNHNEVWNLEFTIKREVLKEFNIHSLDALLLKADSIFKYLMQKNVCFLGYDIDKIKSYRNNKHISKYPMHPIWQHIIDNYSFCSFDVDVLRTRKEYKKGSRHSALDSITRTLMQQLELEQPISKKELLHLHDKVSKEVFYGN